MLRFAIFASGRGSNALKLLEAFDSGFIPAIPALLLSNMPQAAVLQTPHPITKIVVPHQGLTRQAHEQ